MTFVSERIFDKSSCYYDACLFIRHLCSLLVLFEVAKHTNVKNECVFDRIELRVLSEKFYTTTCLFEFCCQLLAGNRANVAAQGNQDSLFC